MITKDFIIINYDGFMLNRNRQIEHNRTYMIHKNLYDLALYPYLGK